MIFQSVYVALAMVACVGSVGFYDMKFTSDFYICFMVLLYSKKANDILPITSLQLRLKTLISSRFQASSFD